MKNLHQWLRAKMPKGSHGHHKEFDKRFRSAMFGGYHKEDVALYIKRLEEGLEASEREVQSREEKIKANKALIEEAISMIQRLHEENKRLREWCERNQD